MPSTRAIAKARYLDLMNSLTDSVISCFSFTLESERGYSTRNSQMSDVMNASVKNISLLSAEIA